MPDPIVCRVDGCTCPTAGKGGWCVGLCDEHISVEGRRRQAVRNAKRQAVKPPPADGQPERTPAPQVAAKSAPAAAPQPAANGTLVALAQAVEATGAEVLEARERHAQALTALRAALDAAE